MKIYILIDQYSDGPRCVRLTPEEASAAAIERTREILRHDPRRGEEALAKLTWKEVSVPEHDPSRIVLHFYVDDSPYDAAVIDIIDTNDPVPWIDPQIGTDLVPVGTKTLTLLGLPVYFATEDRTPYIRVSDVSVYEREHLLDWLRGQTRPTISGLDPQDAVFTWDYRRFRNGGEVID